jgi:hypothetical protein
MATSGLLETAMAVYSRSLGTTHLRFDGKPKCLAGFRTYSWGDDAAFKLASTGKNTFDWDVNPSEGNPLRRINPGGVRVLTRTDNVYTLSQRLVKFYQDFAVVQEEVENDQNLMTLLEAGRFDMFCEKLFDTQMAKREERAATMANEVERKKWQAPHFTNMEDRTLTAEDMYSYFALVNEDYLGLYGIKTATGITGGSAGTDYNTAVAATAGGGKWTTKQSIDVSASRYTVNGVNVMAPRKVTYATFGNAIDGHFTALVRAERLSRYKNPPSVPGLEGGSGIEAPMNADRVIYASDKGMDAIQSATLTTQDLWTTPSRKDPKVYNPSISGVEIEEQEGVTNAAIYDGSTCTVKVTEGSSSGDRLGPRFYLHSRSTLFPVTHKLYWFRTVMAPGNQLQPDVSGEYIDLKKTYACVDFRNQVVIAPSASISGLAAY